jgi:hypothetical protein
MFILDDALALKLGRIALETCNASDGKTLVERGHMLAARMQGERFVLSYTPEPGPTVAFAEDAETPKQ